MLHGSVIEDDVELCYLFVSREAVKLTIFQENVSKVKFREVLQYNNNTTQTTDTHNT